MTTILPSERSSADIIFRDIGQSLGQTLPSAIQRYQGMQAINQLQNELQQAGGDVSKILPAIARAISLNPNLERSGIVQSALSTAAAKNVYGGGVQAPQQPSSVQPQPHLEQQYPGIQPQAKAPISQQAPTQPSLVAPGIMRNAGYAGRKTPDQMTSEAAQAHQVSGGQIPYETRLNQLQTEDSLKKSLHDELVGYAKNAGIKDEDIPDFMELGEQFDTGNREQWFKNTRETFKPLKSAFDKLEKAFIPGLGSALLGRNRHAKLNALNDDVKDLVDMGRENQVRTFLANNYLSPTEIEERIRPITPEMSKTLDKLPRSFFPVETISGGEITTEKGHPELKKGPFVDYDTAIQRAPKQMKMMQDKLTDFFMNNVDDNTSLLVLRDKLLHDRDYDWRQVRDAIKQAKDSGLKLNTRQTTEMTDINQPPIDSLPDMFQDWWRMLQYFRGNK